MSAVSGQSTMSALRGRATHDGPLDDAVVRRVVTTLSEVALLAERAALFCLLRTDLLEPCDPSARVGTFGSLVDLALRRQRREAPGSTAPDGSLPLETDPREPGTAAVNAFGGFDRSSTRSLRRLPRDESDAFDEVCGCWRLSAFARVLP